MAANSFASWHICTGKARTGVSLPYFFLTHQLIVILMVGHHPQRKTEEEDGEGEDSKPDTTESDIEDQKKLKEKLKKSIFKF